MPHEHKQYINYLLKMANYYKKNKCPLIAKEWEKEALFWEQQDNARNEDK